MEEDDNNFAKVVLSESRKTRAQRNKEQRKIAKEREEKKIKDAKELALQVSNIKEINNAVNSTLNMEKSVTVKESSQMRLGPHKFKSIPKALDVTLTEDLADSLRIIKPEGNIFTERFNSLQERGLIEPRVPVGKKRKFKKKVIEVHSYKRFK
ncbi:hypothetical protein HK099_006669 [Clydaea vesicula]|uniref:Ribosome biogenesis protein NOP53 n=1 Tax=Clydaea vesicula TaxID=447962 RepID=A0AAD5TXL2_9FUNG|nr:hypothetical protein HK099_006669 [Clydaea vesicula]